MRTLVVVVLVAACGPSGRRPAVAGGAPNQPSTATPTVGEYAVVSRAARFFVAAEDGAASFRAQTAPAPPDPSEDAAAGVALRVVAVRPGWVEVANPTAADLAGHCQGALDGLAAFDLHFFVPADALAPVVARRYTATYPDGTAIDLLPGLPLGPPGADGHWPSFRPHLGLVLALPADAVARSYAAPSAAMIAAFAPPPEIDPDAAVVINQAHLIAGPHVVVMRDPVQVRSKPVAAGVLVDLVDACSRVTALGTADEVGLYGLGPGAEVGGVAGGTGGASDSDTRFLYPGTKLFWRDGTPAGVAREARSYDLWQRSPRRPDLACIVHDLARPDDTFGPNQEAEATPPSAPSPTEVTLCFGYDDSGYRAE